MTALIALGVERLDAAPTQIIAMPLEGGPRQTGRLTQPTAHQRPQQIAVRVVIVGGVFFIERELGLDLLKKLLPDKRRNHGHKGPFGWGGEVVAAGRFAQGMGSRTPPPGRTGASTSPIHVPGIHRIGKPAAQRSRGPPGIPLWGPHAQLEEMLRYPKESASRREIPSKNLLHHSSLRRLQLHLGGIPWVIRMK